MPAPAWTWPSPPSGEHGADGDAGVEVAGEVCVEDCAAIGAAAAGFQFFNDFHGSDLRCSGERAGGEAGAQGVNGGEFGLEAAFDGADDVHDVRVALDEHEAVDFDGAELADAAYVVAAQVDKHDVLSALLFVVEHFVGECLVFLLIGAAGAGSGDGAVLHFALMDADEQFGR
jgi:hypothetical protein